MLRAWMNNSKGGGQAAQTLSYILTSQVLQWGCALGSAGYREMGTDARAERRGDGV